MKKKKINTQTKEKTQSFSHNLSCKLLQEFHDVSHMLLKEEK